MKRSRRIKILATLGPASNDQSVIEKLVRAGADAFRINMSHASHEVMRDTIAKIRTIEKSLKCPIGILVDLQGPKLRVGAFADGSVMLGKDDTFMLDVLDKPGDRTRVYLPHPEIFESVAVDDRLLLDDGKLELRITATSPEAINTTVVHGGKLSDRKGVSLPDTILAVGVLTEKDRADLRVALESDVDWVALSFVQRPEDLIEVRKIVQGRAGVLAKIEKPQAIDRLEEIIRLSDAIMIARGDLGVEMPLETVPGLQKRTIRTCRRLGKPVVVATQMLESMITAPVPTRAEVSDISIAVFEGADAIMLSAESASGSYPVEAVTTMNKIAEAVEQDSFYPSIIRAQATEPNATAADAISAATRQVAETLNLAAIVTYTSSGSTGIRASRERPSKPILALSPNIATARRLSIVWGLQCIATGCAPSFDDMVERACSIASTAGLAVSGNAIAVSAGTEFGKVGSTDTIRIVTLT